MSTSLNQHKGEGLEIYAQGMCNSSSDKERINQHLIDGTILEIGCGNGAWLQTLTMGRLDKTTAVDMNAHLLAMASSTPWGQTSGVTFVRANVLRGDFQQAVAPGQYNNIVCCSILHELYSELRAAAIRENSMESVAQQEAEIGLQGVFQTIHQLLAPGGRLIIRDGVKPESDQAILQFKNDSVRADFARFVDDHPWFINYREVEGFVCLSKPDLFEFLSKYFYKDNWDVEVLERFGWARPDDLDNMLTGKKMFRHLSCETYLIPWLKSKWEEDFDIRDQGVWMQPYMPNSTMIMVYEKPV